MYQLTTAFSNHILSFLIGMLISLIRYQDKPHQFAQQVQIDAVCLDKPFHLVESEEKSWHQTYASQSNDGSIVDVESWLFLAYR